MSICIGSIEIDDPVMLAPMSGVTDMPFRRLVKRLGAGLVISEMIASQAMIRTTRQSMRQAEHAADEYPMAVQLAGCEPEVIAEAARLNADRGAAIIDINMGCPAKKVVNGYAGSALMRQERLAARASRWRRRAAARCFWRRPLDPKPSSGSTQGSGRGARWPWCGPPATSPSTQ